MKISYYIFFSFLFILLLFSLTTYINFRQSEEVKENAEYVSRSSVIIRNSARFQRNILNMVSGLRGYLLTGEIYFVQAFDSATVENQSILKELSLLIPDTSKQKKALNEIEALNSKWVNEFAYPLRQAKMMSDVSAKDLAAFNKLYREKIYNSNEKDINLQLQEKFREFGNYEYASRDSKKLKLAQSVQRTKNISFTLTTFSVIAGFIIAGLLAYSISNRILKMVHMADSIASGNYDVFVKDKSSDELSKLSASLNHMARMLGENISLLKRKNEELDQFAHVVSHDLKAPLRGIDNVVSWIEEDHGEEISPRVQEYLQMIKGRVVRGENLIQGILSYARVGKNLPAKEAVDVRLLINEVAETLSLRPGLSLEVETDLPVLHTQKFPLLQIFANLIGNAVKYHDKASGTIKVYHKEHPKHYEFFVADDGPGIAKNYHDKIFIIFQTLQERDSFESTGVGLAIVKKILEARKEKIQVVSTPGNGAIFSFTWSKT